ncbi:MAG: RNA polymerase sigma factor RpoH [Alphaproteobacteria bacterium]|nr:RNA polymerase sigma factor RpoH [Alphaproteobacteria bacterium]
MTDISLPVSLGNKGLFDYLQTIKRFPVLEPEEEYMLAKRYHDYQDLEAAHKLVTSHLRLAAKLAISCRNYGLPISDLISEANIGLMTAIKKFNPDKGFRLSTYAVWWIKAALNDFILKSWSLVRIGTVAAQKKLFYNLSRLKAKLGLYSDAELDDTAASKIADTLQVDKAEVLEMNNRIGGDLSLNAPCLDDDNAAEKQDLLADNKPNQEIVLAESEEMIRRRRLFGQAMATLTPREQEILKARRLQEEPATLEELGDKFSVSRERVRQIEARAMEKICKFIKEAA